MQKRSKKDTEFILEGDKSLNSVRAWAKEILTRKEAADFKLSAEVVECFWEKVFGAYEKAESDLVRRMILVKIIHTFEVVRAGFDISRAEKKYVWNEYQVGTVCLLHDVARFDQALLGSFSDEISKFDHAKKGAAMIVDHNFVEFEQLRIEKESVVEAVKHHSEYAYLGQDIYAKLTRDADKLALLRAMPEILAANIGGYPENGVTKEVWRAYKEKKLVRNIDIKNKADLFLAWLAWENDFNFSETVRRFESEGIKKWMQSELKRLGVTL